MRQANGAILGVGARMVVLALLVVAGLGPGTKHAQAAGMASGSPPPPATPYIAHASLLAAQSAHPVGTPHTTLTSINPPLADTFGTYRTSQSTFYLRNALSSGPADESVLLGVSGDIPLAGDWNGDGIESVAVFRPSTATFFLLNSNSPGAPIWHFFTFGSSTDIPIVGDWNGDGRDSIGVFRPATGTFYLRNALSAGAPDAIMSFGQPGDIPLAGNWSGQRHDSVGIYRPSTNTFYLTNSICNCAPTANYVVTFGVAGDTPFTGDWNGDGRTGLGMYRSSTSYVYLRNDATTTGYPDDAFTYGANGDKPISGNWNVPPPTVYAGANSGASDAYLYALRASDGAPRWYRYNGFFATQMIVANNIIYTGAYDSNLKFAAVAYRAADGSLLWSTETCTVADGCGEQTSEVLDNGVAFVAAANNNLFALDLTTGALKWSKNMGNVPWSVAVSSGTLIVGVGVTDVYGLNESTGAQLWHNSSAGSFLTVASGTIYAITNNYLTTQYAYALNASNGSQMWGPLKVANYETTLPSVVGNLMVIGADSSAVALQTSTGSSAWTYTIGNTGATQTFLPAAGNSAIYVPCHDGNLYALNQSNGSLLWQFTTGGSVYAAAVGPGAAYAPSYDSYAYAVNASGGAQIWKYQGADTMDFIAFA